LFAIRSTPSFGLPLTLNAKLPRGVARFAVRIFGARTSRRPRLLLCSSSLGFRRPRRIRRLSLERRWTPAPMSRWTRQSSWHHPSCPDPPTTSVTALTNAEHNLRGPPLRRTRRNLMARPFSFLRRRPRFLPRGHQRSRDSPCPRRAPGFSPPPRLSRFPVRHGPRLLSRHPSLPPRRATRARTPTPDDAASAANFTLPSCSWSRCRHIPRPGVLRHSLARERPDACPTLRTSARRPPVSDRPTHHRRRLHSRTIPFP
jgi:hypothetical protein